MRHPLLEPGCPATPSPAPSARAVRSTIVGMIAPLLVAVAACGGGAGPSASPRHAAARPRFVAVGDGVALDPSTGLEWTTHDVDQALIWEAADRHCRELSRDGRSGWRLPQIAELRALYDKHYDAQCGTRVCHLDAAIHLAGPYVWSATSPGADTRFYFDFAFGSSLSPRLSPELVRRVLCVRQAPGKPDAPRS
jgi:hypothetical protein